MAKKPTPQDWHKSDIKAALEKRGTNMNQLARQNNYLNYSAIRQALQHSYPKAERIIAAAIGVSAETIWPSRYARRQQAKRSTNVNAAQVRNARAV